MANETNIAWTDKTFNPVRGCTKVSPACANCYAEAMSARNPALLGVWGPNGTRIVASEAMWKQPLKWEAQAIKMGQRIRVFCASLADVFEDWQRLMHYPWPQRGIHLPKLDLVLKTPAGKWYPGSEQKSHGFHNNAVTFDDVRDRLWTLIESTPHLDWQLLTKRPENVACMVPAHWMANGFPPNVWLGATVESQEWADKRIPELLKIPAKVRFLSIEPLLGPVDLTGDNLWGGPCPHCIHGEVEWDTNAPLECRHCENCGRTDEPAIHWVIVGGESGGKARPMHPDWALSLQRQCLTAGVPFFFKQWGKWYPELDVEKADPDGRADYAKMKRRGFQVCNLAGGMGFHGERVQMMKPISKRHPQFDKLLGVTFQQFPQP